MQSSTHMSFSILNIVKFLSLSWDTLDLKYTLINLEKDCSLLATLRGMVNKIRKAIAKLGKGTLLNPDSYFWDENAYF